MEYIWAQCSEVTGECGSFYYWCIHFLFNPTSMLVRNMLAFTVYRTILLIDSLIDESWHLSFAFNCFVTSRNPTDAYFLKKCGNAVNYCLSSCSTVKITIFNWDDQIWTPPPPITEFVQSHSEQCKCRSSILCHFLLCVCVPLQNCPYELSFGSKQTSSH